jgi:hypothetical protein
MTTKNGVAYAGLVLILALSTSVFAQERELQADSVPREDTCAKAASCMKTIIDHETTAVNKFDAQLEMLKKLEAFANTRRELRPGCHEGVIRDYISKWKTVRTMQQERLVRMEQCTRRDNSFGRGFDPCPMPPVNDLPRTCTNPIELWRILSAGNSFGSGISGGASTGGSFSGSLGFPGRGGGRSKRSTNMDSESGAAFKRLAPCLQDTCGCPEIEMCMKCYATERFHKDLHFIEREMLRLRWICGLQMKSTDY